MLMTLLAADALACGGFFCNNNEPVLQNAERIAFGVDEEEGTVTAHVQIFYEGPAEEFAWVVPAPSEPELTLGTDQLFTNLQWQFGPRFSLTFAEEGNCRDDNRATKDIVGDVDESESDFAGGDDSDGVVVVSQGQVGPFDTVVLKGKTSSKVVEWLQNEGYDLPDGLTPLLDPYIGQADNHFVALKLQKNKEVGDIEPIVMEYAGSEPMIPIQLTSVAATPDMRLEVYVFGDKRSVPSNYLHVKPNLGLINWWNGGQNYDDVITAAADEAGGHAFATDFSGSPKEFRDVLYREGQYDLERLSDIADPAQWVDELISQGFQGTPSLLALLEDIIEVPAGVDPQDFFNCVSCYDYDATGFDSAAATALIEEFLVEPMREAESLYEYDIVSRMTSSLDAVEMTVDPMFVFNPDMDDVSNQHDATLTWLCNGKKRSRALKELSLPDGREILIPSDRWLQENGMTDFEYYAQLGGVAAQVIEETSASGQPEVLQDHTSKLAAQAEAFNDETLKAKGCGCSTSPLSAGWLLGLLAFYSVRQRRKPTS